MKPLSVPAAALFAASVPAVQAQLQLEPITSLSANFGGTTGGGEITSFDASTDRLFVTQSQTGVASGVNYFDVSNPAAPAQAGFIDFSNIFGNGPAGIFSLTSVAVDPLGRGFGVASVVPTVNTPGNGDYRTGVIGIFDTGTGAILRTLDVGYHPDAVAFSPDGTRVLVSNEGEYSVLPGVNQQPGSVSVLELTGVTAANKATSLPGLTAAQVSTVDFSLVNLAGLRAPAVSLQGLGGNETAVQAMEPEYVSVVGNRAFVSLQDNNALAELDLVTKTWTSVRSLGTITHSIDAISNNPAVAAQTTIIAGMPMPDNIGAFSIGGKTYIATANEGDARVDNTGPTNTTRDDITIGNLVAAGAYPTYAGPLTSAELSAITTLRISRIDGVNPNGSIGVVTTFGTRSVSIFDADTGGLVWDSGNFFETYIADNDPANYADGRSIQKGPEPEALTIGEVDGRTLLVVGTERSNHIFMFDITDPTAPVFQDFALGDGTFARPESINFLSADASPTGGAMLIVGFEGSGPAATEGLAFFAIVSAVAVPEPTPSLLALGGIALAMRRRRG